MVRSGVRSVRITDDVARRIRACADEAGDEEACGLLVGREGDGVVEVDRAVPCENVAPVYERHRRFAIDPRRVIEEERAERGEGRSVVGFYHSHPASDPIPSEVDRRFMRLWPESVWLIAGPASHSGQTEFRAWEQGVAVDERPREIPLARWKGPGAPEAHSVE